MIEVRNQDLVYEAREVRPIIIGAVLRYSGVLVIGLVLVSCLALYAAFRETQRELHVYAITENGDVFPLPIYADEVQAKAAAIVIDSELAAGKEANGRSRVLPISAQAAPADAASDAKP